MITNVLTIDASQNAKNAAQKMTKFGVSSLIVSSGETIVGIVTERDILNRVVSAGQDPNKVMIENIMSQPIIIVNPTTTIEEAIKMMFNNRIKKLPVMQKEDKGMRLVGILTITDIARIQPQLIENLKNLIDQAVLELESESYIR
jgi:CBS domain-containing protein